VSCGFFNLLVLINNQTYPSPLHDVDNRSNSNMGVGGHVCVWDMPSQSKKEMENPIE
jgi:hypothetical protein